MQDFVKIYLLLFSSVFWINLILCALIIFLERKNPTSTWAWIMAITFLPIVGFVAYLFFGTDISKSRVFRSKEYEIELTERRLGRAARINARDKSHIIEMGYGKYMKMIKMFSVSGKSIFRKSNKFQVFNNGEELFETLYKDIENAKKSIYIEFYIISSGKLLDSFKKLLIKKAKEGVDVKILVDGMGGRKFKKQDRKELIDAGVDLGVFFPPILGKLHIRLNYRNHRKITTIDNTIGYIGGFNLGDEYIGLSKKFGHWRDTHLRVRGGVVEDLEYNFFSDYKFATANPCGRYQTSIEDHNFDTPANIVISGPDNVREQIRDGYNMMINQAKSRIFIQTPYFIPDEGLQKSLLIAAYSGVDVRIMVPKKPDHPFVHSAGLSYFGELLEAGARVYRYRENGFLHSKVLIADEDISSVGTANFDVRSFKLNFEINCFIYDKAINEKLAKDFYEDIKNCDELTLEQYKERGKITKIKEGISRLLSPLL
ncbi:MAG: cardiolipin synthase [Tissierellia bacterium]|nr:cardiolipin synthase [Tissierellia bacterium]